MKKPPTLTQMAIKTGALTFAIAFVCFSYGLFIFGFINPMAMAKLSDTLGAKDAAGMYYERVYKNNRTPENAYIVLDRYIMARNHKKIVQYGQKFLDPKEYNGIYEDDYAGIIEKVNNAGRESAKSKFELLSWGNEDSRIKSAYTDSLLKRGKVGLAKARLNEWLANVELEQPNHAFFAFVARGHACEHTINEFKTYVGKFDTAYDHTTFGGEKVFALDFLALAHAYLGDHDQAAIYAEMFNGL
jgi:hypothetical protein